MWPPVLAAVATVCAGSMCLVDEYAPLRFGIGSWDWEFVLLAYCSLLGFLFIGCPASFYALFHAFSVRETKALRLIGVGLRPIPAHPPRRSLRNFRILGIFFFGLSGPT